jgi:hypothetical protein
MVSNTEPLAVPAKSRNKGSRGEWLIAGLAIGILSIIGFFMGNFLIVLLSFLFPGLLPYVTFVGIFLVILIIIVSSIGYTYLKKESAFYFIKLFVFSIIVLFSAFALFLIGQSGGLIIIVEKISIESQINGMNYYVNLNITEKELDEYPALKKAIIECRDFNNCNSEPNIEEWMSTRGFLDKKAHESGYLFSVMDERSEEDLNKGIFSSALRNAFESRGLQLSENAFISQVSYQEVIRWNIIDKKHLFDIRDAELENELKKIDITNGGVIKEAKISKLEEIFKAKGFLSSEKYTVYRVPDKWWVFNNTVNYEIQKENDILKVYTEEKLTYEIWKENGKLNIYHAKLYARYLLKLAGNYYRISERWE